MLPAGAAERRIADDDRAGAYAEREADIGDEEYHVATVALGGGRGAVQVAQKFSETEDLLSALQQRTALLAAAVIALAGTGGWWLARRITGRLVRLTAVAESVAEHGRLDVPVPVAGRDEVARLGRAFDDMLGRLASAVQDQQRLVQDAGHELRTPLTSLRTNISLLKRFDELPPDAREELLADLGARPGNSAIWSTSWWIWPPERATTIRSPRSVWPRSRRRRPPRPAAAPAARSPYGPCARRWSRAAPPR